MRTKITRLICFVLLGFFTANCSRTSESKCSFFIEETNFDSKLFLSLKNTEDGKCLYDLQSNYYYDVDSLWYAKIINDDFHVNMDDDLNSTEVMFSFSDSIGNERYITALTPNWKEKRGNELILRKLKVELINKLTEDGITFFVLKFFKAVYIDVLERELDVCVFFSPKDGFIGTYYMDPMYPDQIIQKEGNILVDKIDYSHFSFVRIK